MILFCYFLLHVTISVTGHEPAEVNIMELHSAQPHLAPEEHLYGYSLW